MGQFEDEISYVNATDVWDVENDDSADWEGILFDEGNADLIYHINHKSFQTESISSILFDQMLLHEAEERVIMMFNGANTKEKVIEHFVHLTMLQDQARNVSYQSYEHIYLLILSFSVPESVIDRYRIFVYQNAASEWSVSCCDIMLASCTSENKARNLGFNFCTYAFELMQKRRDVEVKLKKEICDLERKVERVKMKCKELPMRGAGSQFPSYSKKLPNFYYFH